MGAAFLSAAPHLRSAPPQPQLLHQEPQQQPRPQPPPQQQPQPQQLPQPQPQQQRPHWSHYLPAQTRSAGRTPPSLTIATAFFKTLLPGR